LNYNLWQSKKINAHGNFIQFLPIYAIASNVSEHRAENVIFSRLSGGMSASGTYRFIAGDFAENTRKNGEADPLDNVNIEFSLNKISIDEILRLHVEKGGDLIAVVKVDIEGGEAELFLGACEWLSKTAFLTIEIQID
jgi:hypothetical protein